MKHLLRVQSDRIRPFANLLDTIVGFAFGLCFVIKNKSGGPNSRKVAMVLDRIVIVADDSVLADDDSTTAVSKILGFL